MDHSQCDHPRTKAGRAACRRKSQRTTEYAASPNHDLLQWTQELAISLMTEHGLIDRGWRFEWDRALRRFGRCSWTRQILSLSAVLTPTCTPEEIRDIILHEIAHALVGFVRGDAHGPEWQRTVVAIGGKANRLMTTVDKEMPKSRYILRCPNCGHEWRRHRMTEKARNGKLACALCCKLYNHGKYTEQFALEVIET